MRHSNEYIRVMVFMMAVAVILLCAPHLAWAASTGDDSWVQPGVGVAQNVEAGLVTIGAIIVGIGIIIVGIWACATGRMEWPRMGYVILGAVTIMAGPAMLRALMKAVS